MKTYLLTLSLSLVALCACTQTASEIDVDVNSKVHQLSYYIGTEIGTSMLADGYGQEDAFRTEVLAVGMSDGFSGPEALKVSQEDARACVEAHKTKEAYAYEGTEREFSEEVDGKTVQMDFGKGNDLLGYVIGSFVGANLRGNGFTTEELNIAVVSAALNDKIGDREAQIGEEACNRAFEDFIWEKNGFSREQAEIDKAEGEKFLAENKGKEGVTEEESGLQYEILTPGSGEKPGPTDRVKVHYHGTLIDGTVFDSSVDSGKPAEFGLNQVIKGWTEGLQLMPVGAKYRFYVPADLAYGSTPRPGGKIGPNMMLIFDVELLELLN